MLLLSTFMIDEGLNNALQWSRQRGRVFYVDSTGTHGLVAANTDQSSGAVFSASTSTVTNATANGVGAGRSNTALIEAKNVDTTSAALFCSQYCIGSDGVTACPAATFSGAAATYSDWYLPSAAEISLLTTNSVAAGITNLSPSYRTSTEVNAANAYITVGSGTVYSVGVDGKQFTGYSVRCIRSF